MHTTPCVEIAIPLVNVNLTRDEEDKIDKLEKSAP